MSGSASHQRAPLPRLFAPQADLAQFRRLLGPFCEVAAPEGADFAARVEIVYTGRAALARWATPGFVWERAAREASRAPLPALALRLSDAETRNPQTGGVVAAEAPLLVDFRNPLKLATQGPAAEAWLCFSASRLPSLAAAPLRDGCLRFDDAAPFGHLLRACLSALCERLSVCGAAEFEVGAEVVIGALARILAAEPALAAAGSAPPPLETLEAVQRHIERNLAIAALGPATIARDLGLSRASVYRLFEPLGGVAAYIRRRRLDRAYQEICAPARADRRIGSIAFSLGFKNFSAFSRLFLSEYGMTPLQARKAALPAPAPSAACASLTEALFNLRSHGSDAA